MLDRCKRHACLHGLALGHAPTPPDGRDQIWGEKCGHNFGTWLQIVDFGNTGSWCELRAFPCKARFHESDPTPQIEQRTHGWRLQGPTCVSHDVSHPGVHRVTQDLSTASTRGPRLAARLVLPLRTDHTYESSATRTETATSLSLHTAALSPLFTPPLPCPPALPFPCPQCLAHAMIGTGA